MKDPVTQLEVTLTEYLERLGSDSRHIIHNYPKKSLYVDYETPFVKRIWVQLDENTRFMLHIILPCGPNQKPLFHAHRWDYAVKIIHGSYLMSEGYGEGNIAPKVGKSTILKAGNIYEVTDQNFWHSVSPIGGPVYSISLTTNISNRPMVAGPKREQRNLDINEKVPMLLKFNEFLNWGFDPKLIHEKIAFETK